MYTQNESNASIGRPVALLECPLVLENAQLTDISNAQHGDCDRSKPRFEQSTLLARSRHGTCAELRGVLCNPRA